MSVLAVTRPDAPGIYDLPEDVYHGDSYPAPCLSTGALKDLLLRSPRIAWMNHPALNPDYKAEEAAKFDLGRTAHAMLLGGADKVLVVEADDWRTNAAKAMRDEARSNGMTPLIHKDYDKVSKMTFAAWEQISASELGIIDLQTEGLSEQSFIWEEDGTWFKVRPDWMPLDRSIILDYKTTNASANPEGIARTILSLGYDIQDALYRRGARTLCQDDIPFVFMFQETSEPYLCSFISLPPEFAALGESKVERGISLWRQCLKTGEWPGYPSAICYPELPTWAQFQWELSQGGTEES